MKNAALKDDLEFLSQENETPNPAQSTAKTETSDVMFVDFDLHETLTRSLQKMNYKIPTPIQAQAIPVALEGNDILGSAQTGTGKTAAFTIPLVHYLLTHKTGSALILTPTRELGKQIMDIVHQLLGQKSPINTAFIIGGEPMGKQFSQLRNRPRLIVGTPGRINDHLRRKSLDLRETQFLVLDETDRMLDMGFSVQIDEIVKFLPEQRQTLLFSATLPPAIVKLAQSYQTNPVRIAVGSTHAPAKNIKQDIIRLSETEKFDRLVDELNTREGTVLVFAKTKFGTEKLARRLQGQGFKAEAIHGDLRQRQRERMIREYRNMNFRILVATDVVARGLDIPHIEHVINYDLPQVAEDYIHRIGRTARAGASGSALCLITPADGRKWAVIQKLMNPDAKGESSGSSRSPKPHRGKGRDFGGYGRSGSGRDGGRDGGRYESRGKGGRSDSGRSFSRPRRDAAPFEDLSEDRNDGNAPARTKDSRDGYKGGFGNRERTGRDSKSFGNKSGYKTGGDRRFAEKTRDASRPRYDRQTANDEGIADKPWVKRERSDRSDRPERSDRPARSWGDKPRSDKPRGEKTWGDKPRFDKPRGEKTWGDKPRSDKPRGEKTWGDKPRSDKPRSDRPRSDRPRSDKPSYAPSNTGNKRGNTPVRPVLKTRSKD